MDGTTNSIRQVHVDDRLECSGFSLVYTSKINVGCEADLTQKTAQVLPSDTDHGSRPLIGSVSTLLTQDHHCAATVHRSGKHFGEDPSGEAAERFSCAPVSIGDRIDGL